MLELAYNANSLVQTTQLHYPNILDDGAHSNLTSLTGKIKLICLTLYISLTSWENDLLDKSSPILSNLSPLPLGAPSSSTLAPFSLHHSSPLTSFPPVSAQTLTLIPIVAVIAFPRTSDPLVAHTIVSSLPSIFHLQHHSHNLVASKKTSPSISLTYHPTNSFLEEHETSSYLHPSSLLVTKIYGDIPIVSYSLHIPVPTNSSINPLTGRVPPPESLPSTVSTNDHFIEQNWEKIL